MTQLITGPKDVRRARLAALAFFFANGALFANWAPRIPAVQDGLSIDDTTLGVAMAGLGAGGLLFTLTAGVLVDKVGSRRVLLTSTIVLGLGLALPGLAPSWWTLFLALVVLGAADAAMDVSMNAQGVLVVERALRPLLNGFHASWSVGAVVGRLAGAGAAAVGVPVALQFAVAGVLLGAAALATSSGLLGPTEGDGRSQHAGQPRPRVARLTPPLLLLGLLVVCAAQIEDVPQSWSALYLTDLGSGPGLAGLAVVAFSALMAVGRVAGDRLVERFGPSWVLAGGGLLVAGALALSLVVATPLAAIIGFALVGLGASPMFPVAFSLVGRLPGVLPGAGIAMVSLVSRLGFLVAPLLVGTLIGVADFQWALSVVVLAGLGATTIAFLLHRTLPPVQASNRP